MINNFETEYLNLLREVARNGELRGDRTGVGTYSLFGRQIRADLTQGFPLLTTKKVPFKSVLGELLWFLEGSNDERRLAEITHGSRQGPATIWTPNATATTGSKFVPMYPGDLGRIYGVQWRRWTSVKVKDASDHLSHPDGGTTLYGAKVLVEEHDQIAKIINTLKTNPTDRRMVLSAFNVGELDQMALPPCHMFAQFYVNIAKKALSCQVYIRSNDLFLGLPFNIASYALLTHMLAQVTGHTVGELIITIGDAHIYTNHLDQVQQQLKNPQLELPELVMTSSIDDIDKFDMRDFYLKDYQSAEAIKAPMAA